MTAPILDVITIGRSSVDLYGQQIGGRLEDMASFAKSVGGSPTNTRSARRGSGSKSAADHPRRRRAHGPLHPRAAGARGRRTSTASRPIRTRLTALVAPRHPRRQDLPADLLPRELRRHGARPRTTSTRPSSPRARAVVHHRHAFLDGHRLRHEPQGDRGRQGRWPARRLRHRLPPEAVGPRRPRRRRGALRPLRHGDGAPADDPARLRPDRRHRGGDPHPGGARHARGPARHPRRSPPRRSSASAARWAASSFPAPFPARLEEGVHGARLSGRGLQRARRRRRLHGRLPARLAARRAAGDAPAPTPMPAAPSPSRGSCARRNIRPGRSWSISCATAAPRRALRRDPALEPSPLGDDAPAGAGRRSRRWPSTIARSSRSMADRLGAPRERDRRLQAAGRAGGGRRWRAAPWLRRAARRRATAARRCSTPPSTDSGSAGRSSCRARGRSTSSARRRRLAPRGMAARPDGQVPVLLPSRRRAGAEGAAGAALLTRLRRLPHDGPRTADRDHRRQARAGRRTRPSPRSWSGSTSSASSPTGGSSSRRRARRPGRRSRRRSAPTIHIAAASCCWAWMRRRRS